MPRDEKLVTLDGQQTPYSEHFIFSDQIIHMEKEIAFPYS